MGRVVITHSTYLEGLIPLLRQLAKAEGIDTVTPAVISRVRGRSPSLRLRVSAPILGGHKLVARRGGSAQEFRVHLVRGPSGQFDRRGERITKAGVRSLHDHRQTGIGEFAAQPPRERPPPGMWQARLPRSQRRRRLPLRRPWLLR